MSVACAKLPEERLFVKECSNSGRGWHFRKRHGIILLFISSRYLLYAYKVPISGSSPNMGWGQCGMNKRNGGGWAILIKLLSQRYKIIPWNRGFVPSYVYAIHLSVVIERVAKTKDAKTNMPRYLNWYIDEVTKTWEILIYSYLLQSGIRTFVKRYRYW